jgi:hypothetical protein
MVRDVVLTTASAGCDGAICFGAEVLFDVQAGDR